MANDLKISRALADRLTRAYPAEITDQETMQAMRIEALAALDELRALLAAPAVDRQEPVGFRYRAHGGHWEWMDESPFADGREHYKLGGEELQPLYTSPPAPVADGTTSDKYRAELYDEVWQKARDMGFNNVTDALAKLSAPVAVVIDERAEFEKSVIGKAERFHPDLSKYGIDGEYKHAQLQYAWDLWQARACLGKVKEMNQ